MRQMGSDVHIWQFGGFIPFICALQYAAAMSDELCGVSATPVYIHPFRIYTACLFHSISDCHSREHTQHDCWGEGVILSSLMCH